MISIQEINLLQAQNEGYRKQNKSLQKENAALKGIIDSYQESENEANEIIAELKEDNKRLKEEITELEEKFLTLNCKSYSYYMTLQEIKELINTCMEYRTCERCKFFKMCDKDLEGCILSLITKAED